SNRYQGYKLSFRNMTVDVWSSESNWAFKEKLISVNRKDITASVAHGTFLNYDSLVFDLRSQKLNITGYNECVRTGTIDILRKNEAYAASNPGGIGNVIRLFRIREKTGLNLSEQLCRYIYNQFRNVCLDDTPRATEYLR